MSCEVDGPPPKAKRRYMRDMAIAALIYVALVVGAALVIRYLHPPQWALVILALLPLAPALLMLRAYVTYVNALDELQRRIQSEAAIVAAGVIAFASFAYGFLEDWAHFPRISLIWVFPALSFTFGVTHRIVRWRYK